jgi:UDP-N-acetylmuramyl tripeptide synthase
VVINIDPAIHVSTRPSIGFDSFSKWRDDVIARGILPVIGVTGSRGKTTVVRLLDAILNQAGLQTSTRTDVSVEIRSKRQRGEIAPWSRALAELAQGTMDVAIEELDWLTIHSMGLERETYPVFGVTNICTNRDACLIQGDSKRAIASLPIVFESVHRDGLLVLNGDDFDVSREELEHDRAPLFVGLNRESPGLRGPLTHGGLAAWTEHGALSVGELHDAQAIARTSELKFALDGRAGFQIHNALTAGAIARMIGIPAGVIEAALESFTTTDAWMPDSFRVIDLEGVSVVLDRPNPSWFLRPVLRALKDLAPNRIISVVGHLTGIPASDLPEVGRLIGRNSTLVVSHSDEAEPARSGAIKLGAAQNEIPPVIVHTKTEGRALSRALASAKRGDVVFVLADQPARLARTLTRAAGGPSRTIRAAAT